MTSKERITIALKGGMPDRVPVSPGLSGMVPVRYFTDNYIEFFWKQKIPMWRARVETEYNRFGGDCFMHLQEAPSPHDPPVELSNIQEGIERVTFTRTIQTAKGPLLSRIFIGRNAPYSVIEHYVKNPVEDVDKVLELFKHPDSKDLNQLRNAYEEIGNRGHVGYWVPTPIEWWDSMRGTQNMVMDLIDYPETMKRIFDAYTEYVSALIEYVFSNAVLDSIGVGGSSTSMSVINPSLYREYSLDFGKTICSVSHRIGLPVQYHMCGMSRQALPITFEMGVDGFDALEAPPSGNIDLAEVKKTFGDKVSLRGNVSAISVMRDGTPEDVENDVIRCMNAAKTGGGYILAVGDQVPYDAPEENIYALIEAGIKYGVYYNMLCDDTEASLDSKTNH